ncbi:MAG TPA: hypothetical protein VKV04_23345, partial [Verrucomicrobiae bacterium]|nr:hypothetical protein [Verrucomicrobiae bacterium]
MKSLRLCGYFPEQYQTPIIRSSEFGCPATIAVDEERIININKPSVTPRKNWQAAPHYQRTPNVTGKTVVSTFLVNA